MQFPLAVYTQELRFITLRHVSALTMYSQADSGYCNYSSYTPRFQSSDRTRRLMICHFFYVSFVTCLLKYNVDGYRLDRHVRRGAGSGVSPHHRVPTGSANHLASLPSSHWGALLP